MLDKTEKYHKGSDYVLNYHNESVDSFHSIGKLSAQLVMRLQDVIQKEISQK